MTTKRLLVLFLISGQMLIGQNSKPEKRSEEKVVMQLENDWGDAVSSRDLRKLDKIIADDWTGRYPFYVLTKAQELELIKSRDIKVESVTTSDLKVRFFGNVAVVTGSDIDKGSFYKGKGRERTVSLDGCPCEAERTMAICHFGRNAGHERLSVVIRRLHPSRISDCTGNGLVENQKLRKG